MVPFLVGSLAAALAVGAFAAPACAQRGDGVRRPTFVRVVDERGAPIANATVYFTGGQPHLGELVEGDAQVVASDARGRAQAKLQPGLCYIAWAVGPTAADGSGFLSAPFGFFGAGALFELKCAQPAATRQVACSGADAWREYGPLRFFVMTPHPGTEAELAADAEGRITVPPWPQGVLEVRTADGQPLWSASAAVAELVIPPPQKVAVRVRDGQGAAMAGASIRLRVARRRSWVVDGVGGVVDGRFRDLAITPANGRAEVVVPYAADPLLEQSHGELLLFASVPGRPAVAGGVFARALYQDDRKVAEVADRELVFTCLPGESLVGQCKSAPAGTVAHLAAVCKLFSDRNSYTHDARSFVTTVGADGTFAFNDVPSELHSCRLTLLPPASRGGELPLFAANAGRALPPGVAQVAPRGEAPGEPTSAMLRLRLTDPGGGPARGTVAFLAPGEISGVLLRDSVVRVPLDAAGAAQVPVARGRWIVVVVSPTGYAATTCDVAVDTNVALPMQPLSTMQVRLRDADGRPVVGARVVALGSSTRASGDPIDSMLQSIAGQARSLWGSLRSDGQGSVTIPFVPVKGVTNRLELSWEGGRSTDFTLEANDAPLELKTR